MYAFPIRVSHIRTLLLRKQPASPALVAPASSHSSTYPTPPTPPPSSPTTDAPPQTFTGLGAQQVKQIFRFIYVKTTHLLSRIGRLWLRFVVGPLPARMPRGRAGGGVFGATDVNNNNKNTLSSTTCDMEFKKIFKK